MWRVLKPFVDTKRYDPGHLPISALQMQWLLLQHVSGVVAFSRITGTSSTRSHRVSCTVSANGLHASFHPADVLRSMPSDVAVTESMRDSTYLRLQSGSSMELWFAPWPLRALFFNLPCCVNISCQNFTRIGGIAHVGDDLTHRWSYMCAYVM